MNAVYQKQITASIMQYVTDFDYLI